jgi:lauroyl/myristoyl acyltransferase
LRYRRTASALSRTHRSEGFSQERRRFISPKVPYADAAALMTRVNATLEEWIRDRPEQWLWVHRRWPD